MSRMCPMYGSHDDTYMSRMCPMYGSHDVDDDQLYCTQHYKTSTSSCCCYKQHIASYPTSGYMVHRSDN